ncbi:polyphenol oxidase family protein [Iamia sp. SCSIO 61187]|uniref:polyphenol oxidase family protein n=1 Tax=Iamia sp. SCSIO 61187 TaxID=2722752 RepID=UPI001C6329CE|nr:polyphenol oxidase family protein [Iamia sp. SCSIO 61187]QYG92804.1 polyphenol oxidase family protein [Iamia sp. SCSIO 61187]
MALRPHHLTTTRAAGDLAVTGPPAEVAARRRAVVDLPWTWLTQVHGAAVVTVTRPGQHAGAEADAAVTAVPGAALAVTTADCVPVVLLGAEGRAVGVAHAGWRGLLGGVVGAAAEAMAALGAPPVEAVLGPSICARHYEFGAADLDRVAARWGDEVRATTTDGRPALDVAAGVRRALAEAGVETVTAAPSCTAEAPGDYWSFRARGDAGRIATVAWLEEEA